MIDPWAPPTPAQLEQLRAVAALPSPAPWHQPSRMSLRSVPDARTAVPMRWWVSVIAFLMLGTTTVAILPATGSTRALLIAVAVNLIGYLLMWRRMRPIGVRVGPHSWPSTESVAQDRSDPPTILLPAVQVRQLATGRASLLMLNSAAVGLGASVAWSLVANVVLHPRVPQAFRLHSADRTVSHALYFAVLNSAVTSILEECGIAVLILAVAGVAQRLLPARFDARSVAVTAIVAATVVRTVLHIPLWGIGAVARLGLSFALAWLFWRTRRIWPLITAHVLWDTLSLQTLTSPSLDVRALCALAVLGWAITGTVLAVIAISRSKRDTGRAAQYYRRLTIHPGTPT